MVIMFGCGFLAGGELVYRYEPARAHAQELQLIDAPKLPPLVTALQFPPKHGTFAILPLGAIDGDTIKFAFLIEERGRLAGINARELHEPGGPEAKAFLAKTLPSGPVQATIGPDKYGRVLVDIVLPDGKKLSAYMVERGFAKTWDGQGVKP